MSTPEDRELMLLKDFPPHEAVATRYFLDKSSRPDNIVKLLRNPRHLCCGHKQDGWPTFGILRTIAAVLTTVALVISFVKEYSGQKYLLALGIIEFLIALFTILISLVKHGLKWKKVKHEVSVFEDAHAKSTVDEKSSKSRRKLPGICGLILLGVWLLCSVLLIIGFLICHFLDEGEHTYLEYTKFSTAITLFICWILDSVIMESLNEMTLHLTVDKCKLLIHEIKEELFHELRKNGQEERIQQLDTYINSIKTFKIHEKDRILAKIMERDAEDSKNVERSNEEELLAVVKKIEHSMEDLPKVTFKEPKREEKNQNTIETILSKNVIHGSNEGFVVLEMEDVDGVEENHLIEKE